MITELHKIWNISSDLDIFTGYESIQDQLDNITKADYINDPELVIDTVFALYRTINVVPITYYSEQGLIKEIQKVANYKANIISNNILGLGNNQGQPINRFLFPNMMEAEPKGRKNNSLKHRFFDDVKLKRAIKICFEYREGNKLASPSALRRSLDLVSGENIQNFKPLNARSIADYLCDSMWGRIYDFSAGYGGRMLGIGTSLRHFSYVGTDPNTTTFKYLTYLQELMEEAIGHTIELHNEPSEIYKPEDIDLAFSSPPYFNLEKYCDEPTQCMVRHTNIDAWFEMYVEYTMRNIYDGLNKGGLFAVNIADYNMGKDRFNIIDRWKELTIKMGFTFQFKIDMLLNSRPGVGNKGRQKTEGIFVFRK